MPGASRLIWFKSLISYQALFLWNKRENFPYTIDYVFWVDSPKGNIILFWGRHGRPSFPFSHTGNTYTTIHIESHPPPHSDVRASWHYSALWDFCSTRSRWSWRFQELPLRCHCDRPMTWYHRRPAFVGCCALGSRWFLGSWWVNPELCVKMCGMSFFHAFVCFLRLF